MPEHTKALSKFSMKLFFAAISAFWVGLACSRAQPESGFVSIFDGKTLDGWKLAGRSGNGYGVTNDAIYCSTGESGNLFTEKEYSDFVLRFEFKLTPGANNGIGIRAPYEGDAAYMGMEIQVLDDSAPQYTTLQPWQFHGSIYNIVAARRGSLKPVGEWNAEEISATGRHIKIVVNGKTIVDANLNSVTDPETIRKHPGMFRDRGHIGFLGHGDYVEFRKLRIREIPVRAKDNTPPEGFVALFNGRTLGGWKGLFAEPYDNPAKRASLAKKELVKLQAKADGRMREHWKAANGQLNYDGHGDSLCTKKDYRDFEMLVDWKIPPRGDSGIYLRGSPQVQIWDPFTQPMRFGSEVGSGGLYNNKKNPSSPFKVADRPIGEWNRFRIIMVGERVHVFLNGELVTRDTVLENYWERDKPVYPSGDIQLQNHSDPLWFKNIYIRELPRK
jgi:3-keto-disaccharide hydrolase